MFESGNGMEVFTKINKKLKEEEEQAGCVSAVEDSCTFNSCLWSMQVRLALSETRGGGCCNITAYTFQCIARVTFVWRVDQIEMLLQLGGRTHWQQVGGKGPTDQWLHVVEGYAKRLALCGKRSIRNMSWPRFAGLLLCLVSPPPWPYLVKQCKK